jgi:hypothetical protein
LPGPKGSGAPVELEDGGLAIVFDDGRTPVPVIADGPGCEVDAGAFLRLLAVRDCERDADCRVYRHGLDVDELDACYPARNDVVDSRKFAREYQALGQTCGFATVYSTQVCSRAICVQGRCELAGQLDDGDAGARAGKSD